MLDLCLTMESEYRTDFFGLLTVVFFKQAPAYVVLKSVIQAGCKVAIYLSERL